MIQSGAHIHLMGICGTAMASLAGLLKNQGYRITGSDQNVYPPMSTQLAELGITIQEGYKKENLSPEPDLVIVGNVITRRHEEAQALMSSDIPYTSLPKALGEYVIQDRQSVVIAGTHGKTTTTSIFACVAEACNKQAGFLIGGIPKNFSHSFRAPQGDWFIIEGDEYDTAFFDKVPKFVHYKPKFVILSSLEFDHVDIYENLEAIKAAFRRLVDLIPKDGLLVANADDENVMQLVGEAKCRVVTYGLGRGDYQAVEPSILVGRNQFAVAHKGSKLVDIALKLFGDHNTLNALAAFALARELGWDLSLILQGLAQFQGVKRRQEILGEPNGITVIEDFAHHPTAVRLTIESLCQRYPGRRLIAVFEPRSATSRRSVFQEEYFHALKQADLVLLTEPFHGEQLENPLSSQKIVERLNSEAGKEKSHCMQDADAIVDFLTHQAQREDVIVIMSNGAFDGIYQKLLTALDQGSSTS